MSDLELELLRSLEIKTFRAVGLTLWTPPTPPSRAFRPHLGSFQDGDSAESAIIAIILAKVLIAMYSFKLFDGLI